MDKNRSTWKMSQIKKSASFRSRIPIRRAKLPPRRCYSPEPYRHSSMFDPGQNNYDVKPFNYGEKRISKQKIKRQRHVATTLAQQTQFKTESTKDITNFPAAARSETIYSSSSYSSSDESQESESPPQVHIYFIRVNSEFSWDFKYIVSVYSICLNVIQSMLINVCSNKDILQFIVNGIYIERER